MKPEIFVPKTPGPEHRETLVRLLDSYNDERFPDPVRPLALLLRDPGGEAVIGGLWGVSYWQWLFVDQFFIPEQCRGNGLGTRLLQQAEDIARERGCIGVWLFTFSFQAPAFYRKLGYSAFGQIPDYPQGQNCTYFRKFL